ncbi:hypothetical protein CISIN_1g035434mg [Citrus sinensis]|uniref:Uncharacterized protein n=1 Tax=Citrus sinensis TaxID=2711 RepID=A0A067HB51_CITSI|nr:hypothetical protein CISIN_1g035434mg [Citrus sinensis]
MLGLRTISGDCYASGEFALRPKLISCNAEAAGVDAGATDNLRRLLRLR